MAQPYHFDQLVEARLLLAEIEGLLEYRKQHGSIMATEREALEKIATLRAKPLYPQRDDND